MIVRSHVLLLGFACAALGCGGGAHSPGTAPNDAGPDATAHDGGGTPVAASDPCLAAGYHFDGKSDCDVVRCPELRCECSTTITGEKATAVETLSFHACVRGQGCVDRVSCEAACDTRARLQAMACAERLTKSAAACTDDDDCVTGHCRTESAGKLCVDLLGCSGDGDCSLGFVCRFSPGSTTSLGRCSDGSYGSACYQDDQCKYHKCSGNSCSGGRDNDACESDEHCASGFCRSTTGSGYCVSGAHGGSCADDGDCGKGLHCSGGVCYSSAVGESCDNAADCESGICVGSICRGGEPGSLCTEDAHCKEGVCANGLCASGGLFSPCSEAADCKSDLRCARGVCSDGSVGSPCSTDTDCSVRACARGSCSEGRDGDICDAPTQCQSGRCADPAGVEPGVCTSGAAGSPCVYGSNCVSATCSLRGTCD